MTFIQSIQSKSLQNTRTGWQTAQLFVVSSVSALLVVTLQDWFHAYRNQYGFYLTESFLFNSFWLWFWPVALLYKYFFDRMAPSGKGKELLLVFAFGISASVLHAWVYVLSVSGISYFFYSGTYGIPKMLGYTLSHDLYKYIFAYAALGLWCLWVYQAKPKREDILPDVVMVGNGRNNIRVPVASIILIRSASPYVALHTSTDVHLHTASLKSLLENLPPDQFVQVHKSAIVNIGKVLSYKSRLNGDYDIILEDGQQVRLSRNYAARFKQLMDSGSSA